MNNKMEVYFMASNLNETMEFLKRFVRDVPARPVPGQRVDVTGFEEGVVQNTVRLGGVYLNEAVGSKGLAVKKAIKKDRFFIAYYDQPRGELGHCGVVLREPKKGRGENAG